MDLLAKTLHRPFQAACQGRGKAPATAPLNAGFNFKLEIKCLKRKGGMQCGGEGRKREREGGWWCPAQTEMVVVGKLEKF